METVRWVFGWPGVLFQVLAKAGRRVVRPALAEAAGVKPQSVPTVLVERGVAPRRVLVVFFPGFKAIRLRSDHKVAAIVRAARFSALPHIALYWADCDLRDAHAAAAAAADAIRVYTIRAPCDVLIVGESYGGIAAMRLAEQLDFPNVGRVHVVTAASPLHGTGWMRGVAVPIFTALFGKCGVDLVPARRRYRGVEGRHFAAAHDHMVWPRGTTTPEGHAPTGADVLPDTIHSDVMLHPRVLVHITDVLTSWGK